MTEYNMAEQDTGYAEMKVADKKDIVKKDSDTKKQCGGMELCTEGPVPYLKFPALSDTGIIRHGFSTKLGGVSQGVCASMNLSFERGDDPEAVRENYRRIASSIGFSVENLVFSKQTHTANIRIVTEEDRGAGYSRPIPYTDVDGLITNIPNLVLTTFYADCVPLFFTDPVKRVIALVHSGWRGTVGKIGAGAVRMMREHFGSDPSDILAAIGPSIGQECYEVSKDVVDAFREEFTEAQMSALAVQKENGKYLLDLWKANQIIIREAGILSGHLFTAGICTCCQKEWLFSHRATNGKRGNLAAFLELLPD